MKIYVASKLDNYEQVIKLENELKQQGHEITYSWASSYKSGNYEDPVKIAIIEEQAVRNCDLLIFIPPGGRGAHFELGLARGLGKSIKIISNCDNLIAFCYLPGIEYA